MNQPLGERCTTKENVSSITLLITPVLDIDPPLYDSDKQSDVFPLDKIVEWYEKNTMHAFEVVERDYSNDTFKIRVEMTELEKDDIRKMDEIEGVFAVPDSKYPLHGGSRLYDTAYTAFITAEVQIVD